jgi:hypothetical protein
VGQGQTLILPFCNGLDHATDMRYHLLNFADAPLLNFAEAPLLIFAKSSSAEIPL